jgi:tetratricopeptide (TPR) repeat protein
MPDTIDNLMERAVEAVRNRRLDEAKADLFEAIDVLRSGDSDPRVAAALRELAEVERKLGERDLALQHYQEAVNLLRSQKEPFRLAHTIRHLGDVYHDMGQNELAGPCYREALELYRRNEGASQLDLANAIRSMAVLKEETGASEEAKVLWTEARQLYIAGQIEPGVAESSRRLARLVG